MNETTQYLTYTLGEEVFALDIGKVREVLDFTSATKVPRTPDFVRGVINLRGGVVPVVDLRLKFGMTRTEKTVNTCVIIAEANVDHETTVLGCLADSVQEVIDLGPGQIEPAPRIGTKLRTSSSGGWGSTMTASSSSSMWTRSSRRTNWPWCMQLSKALPELFQQDDRRQCVPGFNSV